MRLRTLLFRASGICAFAVAMTLPLYAAADKNDYYNGLDLYHAGDYAGALSAFESQLKKTPGDETVQKWADLARKRIEEDSPPAASGSFAPAAPAAAKTAPPVPKTPKTCAPRPASTAKDDYERGIALYLAKQYPESIEAFRGYLAANPGHMATQQWITLVEGLLPKEAAKSPKALPKVLEPEDKPESPAPSLPREVPVPSKPESPFVKTPAVSASREQEYQIEIARLKLELEESREQTQRAIEQTKKALAIPSPSFQNYEEEKARKAMAQEIDSLREENTRLAAELGAAKKAARPAAPVPDPATERKLTEAQRALSDMTRRYDEAAGGARKQAEAQRALERQTGELEESQNRLRADLKEKDTELADARTELKRAAAEKDREFTAANAKLREADAARLEAERKLADAEREVRDLESSRAETTKLQGLLEQSRAQGLGLAQEMQKERKLREELEARLAEKERLIRAVRSSLGTVSGSAESD